MPNHRWSYNRGGEPAEEGLIRTGVDLLIARQELGWSRSRLAEVAACDPALVDFVEEKGRMSRDVAKFMSTALTPYLEGDARSGYRRKEIGFGDE